MKFTLLSAVLLAAALPLSSLPFAPASSDDSIDVHVAKLAGSGEHFSLKQLADGESKTFGSGDEAVTITRRGDSFEITTADGDDARTIKFNCSAGDDDCLLLGHDGDEHPLVFISRSDDCPEGEEGERCQKIETKVIALAGAHATAGGNLRMIHVDEDGEAGIVHHLIEGLGEGMVWNEEGGNVIVNVEVDGDGPHVITLGDPDKVRLVCPKGDATLTVKKEDADRQFFCPQHNELLEETKIKKKQIRKIIREKK